MKILVGDWEVLASGMLHSRGKMDVSFELAPDMILKIIVKDLPGQPAAIDLTPEEKYLLLTFTNPNTILHFGPQEPIFIGTFEGRELHIQIRINTFGEFSSYSVDYTFFKGAKIG